MDENKTRRQQKQQQQRAGWDQQRNVAPDQSVGKRPLDESEFVRKFFNVLLVPQKYHQLNFELNS
ncbi:hypothetical protein RUM43_011153 [Polyplax serrata]|uniref:Uncharacterized protein n=1 Tax=Polyplax serrata TaxID=468196 RepID=A0AAN8PET6_POLSC